LEADPCREAVMAARVARADANSMFYGASRARIKGIGLEYVDFREYSFGDDVRHVDWRLSARMIKPDGEMRLIVKEYEAERRVHVVFAADLSGSRLFGSKLWVLVYSASLASHLASRLEDEATLITLGRGRRVFWRVQPGLIPRILYTLICKGGVGGDSRLGDLIPLLRRLGAGSRLMLLTDYDHRPGEAYMLAKTLRLMGARGQAIIASDRAEVEPPVDGNPLLAFRSMEGGGIVLGRMDELYSEIRRHVRSVRAAFASKGMGVLELRGREAAVRGKARIAGAYLALRSGLRMR